MDSCSCHRHQNYRWGRHSIYPHSCQHFWSLQGQHVSQSLHHEFPSLMFQPTPHRPALPPRRCFGVDHLLDIRPKARTMFPPSHPDLVRNGRIRHCRHDQDDRPSIFVTFLDGWWNVWVIQRRSGMDLLHFRSTSSKASCRLRYDQLPRQ